MPLYVSRLDDVEDVVSSSHDVNFFTQLYMWTQKGDTPLHLAAAKGNNAIVDKLLAVEGINKVLFVTMQNKVRLVSVCHARRGHMGGTCMHGDPQRPLFVHHLF